MERERGIGGNGCSGEACGEHAEVEIKGSLTQLPADDRKLALPNSAQFRRFPGLCVTTCNRHLLKVTHD